MQRPLPDDVARIARAYLASLVPTSEVSDAWHELVADTSYWGDSETIPVLRLAHQVVLQHSRVTDEVAASALVDVGITAPEQVAEVLEADVETARWWTSQVEATRVRETTESVSPASASPSTSATPASPGASSPGRTGTGPDATPGQASATPGPATPGPATPRASSSSSADTAPRASGSHPAATARDVPAARSSTDGPDASGSSSGPTAASSPATASPPAASPTVPQKVSGGGPPQRSTWAPTTSRLTPSRGTAAAETSDTEGDGALRIGFEDDDVPSSASDQAPPPEVPLQLWLVGAAGAIAVIIGIWMLLT